jgi:hypothetical protein
MRKHEGEATAIHLVKSVRESGKLVAMPSLVTRSGHRCKIENGELYEYVSGYAVKDGIEVPIEESVRTGASLEVDVSAGYDAVDLNLAFSYGSGEIKSRTVKVFTPLSGREVEVEKITYPIDQISVNITLMDGQIAFGGVLEQNQKSEDVLMFFVTVSSSVVDSGPVLPK